MPMEKHTDYVNVEALIDNLVFITYLAEKNDTITTTNTSNTNKTKPVYLYGILVDLNGTIFSNQPLELGQSKLINGKYTTGTLYTNRITGTDQKKFFYVMDLTLIKLTLSLPSDDNPVPELLPLNIATFVIAPETLFPLVDGGYGMIYIIKDSNKNTTSDPTDVKYRVYVSFINTKEEVSENFLIYQSVIPLLSLSLNECNNELEDTGGGYLKRTIKKSSKGEKSSISESVYTKDGDFFSLWDFPEQISEQFTPIYGIFPNDTVWQMTQSVNGTWSILSTQFDLPNSKNTYENPFIVSMNVDTRNNISITFNKSIELSTGTITIYQKNSSGTTDTDYNNNDILRQKVSIQSGESSSFIALDEDGKTMYLKVLTSTFNRPSENYYLVMQSNFVKLVKTGEPLLGIRKDFNALVPPQDKVRKQDEPISGLLRLTTDGSQYLDSRNSKKDKEKFFSDLKLQLAKSIPVDPSRLSISSKCQYDPKSNGGKRTLFSIKITNEGTQTLRNTNIDISNDLNTLIKYKNVSPISEYPLTKYLDDEYGFVENESLWEPFGLFAIIGIVLLLVLFIFAYRVNSEAANMLIFFVALILLDFALDVTFLVKHGKDVSWLFLPSLLVLIISAGINFVGTTIILVRETTESQLFSKWFRNNTDIAILLALFGTVDVEIVRLLWSNLFDAKIFKAPVSDRTRAVIFWMSSLSLIIEDIPQLVFQVLYQTNSVKYSIIPLMTLVTSIIIVAHNVFGRCFLAANHLCMLTLHLDSKEPPANEADDEIGGIPASSQEDELENPAILQQFLSNNPSDQQLPPHAIVTASRQSTDDEDTDTIIGGSSFPEASSSAVGRSF
ncbi:8104_t:CDS:10 [Ambispora gerdemannii]|uniref:8104_t:CDS:1 n=1 Tax=Ambispora gerdemannii TaxID=144530 RepID=A0A9N8UYQ6_9GLOM|nr:8104_t:CDS:10 [Ambispora gerdemannii]